jgi:hypothetical protein
MLAELPKGLLDEWAAFAAIEPFGPRADDERHAELCSAATDFRVAAGRFLHRPPWAIPTAARPLGPPSGAMTPAEIKAAVGGQAATTKKPPRKRRQNNRNPDPSNL